MPAIAAINQTLGGNVDAQTRFDMDSTQAMNNLVKATIADQGSPARAGVSLCVKWEPESSGIDENNSQDEKHDDPRTARFRAISTDSSDRCGSDS
jgi:hypothetical protein